jgi:hypothetical protein
MSHDLRWLPGALFILTISATFCAPTHAQGVYASADEGVGDIATDLSGYAGSGCPATASLYSELNGVLVQGGLGFDNIVQTVRANPGVTYIWAWGFTLRYTNPYTGLCDSYSENFAWFLSLTTTYYGAVQQVGQTCHYNSLACTAGSYPTCPQLNECSGVEITGNGSCSPNFRGSWLVISGTCEVCVGYQAYSPGYCN